MKKYRFYCEKLTSGRIELGSEELHHLIHVLRLGPGQEIELFDGQGNVASAVIREASKKKADIEAFEFKKHPTQLPPIIMAVSLPKRNLFDFLIEKCTELGIDQIQPVLFERTIKQGSPSAVERFNKIAIGAVKQSGRFYLPQINPPISFKMSCEKLRLNFPDAAFFYGGFGPDSKKPTELIAPITRNANPIVFFIGPEGGLTDQEESRLRQISALPVCINPNVLRIETAAIAFSSLFSAFRASFNQVT